MGYDREGYNKNGYDKEGFDKKGYNIAGYDREGYDRDGYNHEGYNQEGYDKNGYNREGHDRDGYDKNGYDIFDFDRFGFNKFGYNCIGFNKYGYDKNGYGICGFDRNGYDRTGYNKKGFDKKGYNRSGYNVDGYDKEGYNRDGYDKEGYNRLGYNKKGFDRAGYNKDGFNSYGFNVIGYDIDGYNIFGRDQEGYGFDGYDKAGYNREGFNKLGIHKDNYDENGFNKYTGYNIKGYNKEGYNENGYDKDGFDRSGFNISGFNKYGYNKEGYNKDGYNREGYNKEGYDKSGYNKDGYDKFGYDKEGFDKKGYNIAGYDKFGYDKNGLNINGNRITAITSPEQIKGGLRIKNKTTGERGKINVCGKTRVGFTMDNNLGTTVLTETTIENFMKLFVIEDAVKAGDYEREALYNTKVRHYLYSTHRDMALKDIEHNKKYWHQQLSLDERYELVHIGCDEGMILSNAEKDARKVAEEAYFAHIDCRTNPDLYIGKKALGGYVVDWTDKQAAYYYNYEIYVSNQDLGINFVRDITLKDGVFSDFNDLYNHDKKAFNVADKKLIEIITRNRESKAIHDIIESIQTKQYEIITRDIDKGYLVLGCAGSGKTMILLHRIRFLLFNYPNVAKNNLVIVSPTDILGRENEELAKILNIDNVNQCYTASFYANVIKDILQANGMFDRVAEFKICDSNITIDDSLVASSIDIIDGRFSKKQDYIENAKKRLYAEKKQLELSIGESNLLNENMNYLNAIKEVEKISKSDIDKIIEHIRKRVENKAMLENREAALILLLEFMGKRSDKKENYDVDKINRKLQNIFKHIDKIKFEAINPLSIKPSKSVVRFVQITSFFSEESSALEIKMLIDSIKSLTYGEVEYMIYSLNREIKLIKKLDKIAQALENLIDITDFATSNVVKSLTSQEVIEQFKSLYAFSQNIETVSKSANVNPFMVFKSYNDIVNEIQMLNNANTSNDYVFDMLLYNLNIQRNREKCEIRINKQQLQKILHILIEKFYMPNNDRLYFFLDEFQDYTVEEIKDIKKQFPNSIINLYGDVNQCINISGIDDVSRLEGIITFDGIYELKDNYRNSEEVTEYVNKHFGMDMYKIGLPGKVTESTSIYLEELTDNDRGAIIVADETIVEQLKSIDMNINVHYYNSDHKIYKNCYNVLTVAQAKGLEYEKVVVIDKNMTKNQLYVACTRAIRDLDIITLS